MILRCHVSATVQKRVLDVSGFGKAIGDSDSAIGFKNIAVDTGFQLLR